MSVVPAQPPSAQAPWWWWQTSAAVDRVAFAFVAFPPGWSEAHVTRLANETVCSQDRWTAQADFEPREDGRLACWTVQGAPNRHTSGPLTGLRRSRGAVLSIVVVAYCPLTVVIAPGDCTAASLRAGVPPAGGAAVRAAVRRFVAAARTWEARVVMPSALPELIAWSWQRETRIVSIAARKNELVELARVRMCPRCRGGHEPGPRWCPTCEYEFTPADDHARDQQALARQREEQVLEYEAAQLRIESFPPVWTPPWKAQR